MLNDTVIASNIISVRVKYQILMLHWLTHTFRESLSLIPNIERHLDRAEPLKYRTKFNLAKAEL